MSVSRHEPCSLPYLPIACFFLLFDVAGSNAINHEQSANYISSEIPLFAFSPFARGVQLERVKGFLNRDENCPPAIRQSPHHRGALNDASSEKRREFISSTITSVCNLGQLILTISSPRTVDADDNTISYVRLTSPRTIAQYIHNSCNSIFLSSVIRSDYNFLYRGLSSKENEAITTNDNQSAIIIMEEPYDLLDSETYNSIDAASYFHRLERAMVANRMPLKPSNSHLGTTCSKTAAQWGRAASIWPLGEDGVEFAWSDGELFWTSDETGSRQGTMNVLVGDEECNLLSDALQGDAWEIMFRADNGFVAVPAELDGELREYLKEMQG